jgi:putative Mg2+ transporter-C (MgtC) family protein
MNYVEILLKLFLAVALGGLIGLERETSKKPAGFRTNILICVGSTMMMIVSSLLLQNAEENSGDLTRIAAGIITGIGFIGGGTIIQARGMIIAGLTTAATLWTVAGLGLLIGSGYYITAIIFTSVIMLVLIIFRKLENQILKKTSYNYYLKIKEPKETLSQIRKLANLEDISFREFNLRREKEMTVVNLAFSSSEETAQKFNQSLIDLKGILEINIE